MAYRSLAQLLQEHPSISFVAFQWVDYSGHLRARMLTKEYALQVQRTEAPVSSALVHMTILPDNVQLPGHPATAVEYFAPDWQSARTFSFDDEQMYAAVTCNIVEKLPNQLNVASRCPRTVLQRVLYDLRHLDMLVGFEIEFNILDATTSTSEEMFGYSSASVFSTKSFDIVRECVKQLQRNGVSVCTFHSEGAGNQFEISTGPSPPLAAIDTLVQTLNIIRGVAARHGRYATMYPTPHGQKAKNGLHANFSFNPTTDESAFIAGIMNRLPVLLAFSMPSEDSYKRLARSTCGSWVSWGTQNRDCPLRKVCTGRYEIRSFDSTANPYIAMAAYLAAGVAGVHRQEVLILPDCDQWVSDMTTAEREGWGIKTPLPTSLSESVQNLERDCMQLDEYLGSDIISRYVQLKMFQLQHFAKMGPEKTTAIFAKAY